MDAQLMPTRISPCEGCHWFEACAQLNAICEAWSREGMGKPWDEGERVPMHRPANSILLRRIPDEQLVRAFDRARSNYSALLAARPALPNPPMSDEDINEAA